MGNETMTYVPNPSQVKVAHDKRWQEELVSDAHLTASLAELLTAGNGEHI